MGKFALNGRCGYILKPSVMTVEGTKYNPFMMNDLDNVTPISLYLKCLSVQHLGLKGVRPYVAVKTFGLHEIEAWKTPPSTHSKSVSHTWAADNLLVLERVVLPSMTLLYLSVHDHKDDSALGYVVLSVESIRTGYHHIPLLGAASDLANIFIEFKVSAVQPQQHLDFLDILVNPTVSGACWIMLPHSHQFCHTSRNTPRPWLSQIVRNIYARW